MFHKSTDTRVAAFFADGLEECEALVICDLLYRAGIECDKVSISDNLAVRSSHDVTLVCDCSLQDEDFDFDNYDVLFLPGGMPGTTNLRACEKLCEGLKYCAASGKTLAAICAAPSVLAELGLLQEKRATSFPSFQHILTEQGAKLEQAAVVEDGTFVTSQGLGTAIDLGLALVRRICGADTASQLQQSIVDLRV